MIFDMTIQHASDNRLAFDMADRLRRALRISGVSVQEMADELDVSRNTVSNWINGRGEPRRRDLRDFAMKTGFPMEWLRDGTGEMTQDGPDGGGQSDMNYSRVRSLDRKRADRDGSRLELFIDEEAA